MARFSTALATVSLAALAACSGPDDGRLSAQGQTMALPGGGPGLSQAQREVSQIAARNGDQDYIMVDKARGEVLMFKQGQPILTGSALTGESLADRLPPGALDKPFVHNPAKEDKITPAGRYTVSIEPDPHYGDTLSVNEVQGKDWDIAIHLIFLGFANEHRDRRLASSDGREKHITWGCIDVSGPVIRSLVENLPDEDATPIYILPTDQTHLASFFPPIVPGARVANTEE